MLHTQHRLNVRSWTTSPTAASIPVKTHQATGTPYTIHIWQWCLKMKVASHEAHPPTDVNPIADAARYVRLLASLPIDDHRCCGGWHAAYVSVRAIETCQHLRRSGGFGAGYSRDSSSARIRYWHTCTKGSQTSWSRTRRPRCA